MRRSLVLFVIVVAGTASMAARQAAPAPQAHRFQQVAEGVYAALGTGTINTGSNSVVIVNADDVVVVDSHVTPAAARALVEDIRTLTPKPVRYVIDTHYHWDHAHGNQVFGPDVQVIGHEFVREMLRGDVLDQRTYRSFTDPLPAQVRTLEAQAAAATSPEQKRQLEARVAAQKTYLSQLAEIRPTPPTVTYQTRMTLVRGGREIQLLFLGRGHTGGDTVVYLPAERLIATGDLIVGDFRFMYMGDAFVNEWADTVDKVLQLDFATVVPGHGAPFQGKDTLRHYQAYWRDLWQKAGELRARGVAPEEAARTIDLAAHKGNFPSIQGPGVDVRAMQRMYELMAGASGGVTAATQAWADAFNSRDPQRVRALYAPDAVFWGTSSPILRDTPALIAEYFAGLPSRPNERVELGASSARVYGDIAINSGSYTFTDVRDGKPVRRPARFTFVFRQVDGRWLIADHHSSAAPASPM